MASIARFRHGDASRRPNRFVHLRVRRQSRPAPQANPAQSGFRDRGDEPLLPGSSRHPGHSHGPLHWGSGHAEEKTSMPQRAKNQRGCAERAAARLTYRLFETPAISGISLRTIHRDAKLGRLRVEKRGRVSLVFADDLEAYLAGNDLSPLSVRG